MITCLDCWRAGEGTKIHCGNCPCCGGCGYPDEASAVQATPPVNLNRSGVRVIRKAAQR